MQLVGRHICGGHAVHFERVTEVRSVAQVDKILPAEPSTHMFQKNRVRYREIISYQFLVAVTPRVFLRDEECGEVIGP